MKTILKLTALCISLLAMPTMYSMHPEQKKEGYTTEEYKREGRPAARAYKGKATYYPRGLEY